MKKFTIILVFALIGLSAKAQFVTIPDANFAAYLQSHPDCWSCITGNQLDTTLLSSFWYIDVSNLNISDLTGIEYFHDLFSLNCSNNNLTSIPSLHSPALSILLCAHNNLTSLPNGLDTLNALAANNNQLTSATHEPRLLLPTRTRDRPWRHGRCARRA